MIFDTHVHFDDFVADNSFEEILQRTDSNNVSRMVAVGGSVKANDLSLRLAKEFPNKIYGSVGYDRDLAGEDLDFNFLKEKALDQSCVAIGEIGLDYFYEPEKAKEQKELFIQCLEVSSDVCKPVIIHSRDADEDMLGILREFVSQWKGDPSRVGVLHCFTRDEKMAKALLDLGFYISLSGIVTFRNADTLREVAKFIPEDRLLIETDSPYLAPVPHRGKRNEPSFVVVVAKHLAETRGCSLESIIEVTCVNACHLFGLSREDV